MLYISKMKSTALIKKIEKDGWFIARTKGSHHHFKHPKKKGIVPFRILKKIFLKVQ